MGGRRSKYAPDVMNGIHGVDISGFIHSAAIVHNNINNKDPSNPRTVPPLSDTIETPKRRKSLPHIDNVHTRPSPARTTSSPSIMTGTATTVKPPAPSPSPTLSRRPSWLLNISSKFSSSNSTPEPNNVLRSPTPESQDKQNSQPGFLISTLRRLSATGTNARDAFGRTKSVPTVGRHERVVLNRDQNRERCLIAELNDNKLRKVAFCVDVEVAPSTEDVEARKEARRKRREAREKEKEKETLKELDPEGKPVEISVGEKNPVEDMQPSEKEALKEQQIETKDVQEVTLKEVTGDSKYGKLEKKIEETKSTTEDAPASEIREKSVKAKRVRVHARPTTDPVKIYTQCCQLRETKMVEEIKDELVAANGAAVLQKLNLSGNQLQTPDVVAFSDFLALVPVKVLILEDCGLTDEMVRVVLSALSAVKTPNQGDPIQRDSHSTLGSDPPSPRFPPRPSPKQHFKRGVVERLSLKNNPRISREGWRYISCFVHMSHTLRALDVSKIPLPRPSLPPSGIGKLGVRPPLATDTTGIFARAIRERLVGTGLDELGMGNCSLNSEQVKAIMEGVSKGGTRRLALDGNSITDDGVALIGQWMKGVDMDGVGVCEFLDLSNNDLQEHIDILSASINEVSPLCALSLSNCNLSPASLASLLPALAQAPNFRWLDLSNNPLLFSAQPDSLSILRRFLPRMSQLRKVVLRNTHMTPDHAIAISEILPEVPLLAFFSIADNHLIPSGTTSMDEGSLEEGAALYTALSAAVKVSKTIVRVDIDEPGPEAGAVIQNLSRRLLSRCLRNLENNAPIEDEHYNSSLQKDNDDLSLSKQLTAIDSNGAEAAEDEEDAPASRYEYDANGVWQEEDNYVVGGTGVVKALGVCLGNKSHNARCKGHGSVSLQREDTASSCGALDEEDIGPDKAGEMSKALLTRARKIKQRIQPALRKSYTREIEEYHHRRLLFLDETLHRVIQRFEEEYPECKEPVPTIPEPIDIPETPVRENETSPVYDADECASPSSTTSTTEISQNISRRSSHVSLHSRHLENEEGQMHKLAQYMKKEIFQNHTNEVLELDECVVSDGSSVDETRERIINLVENLEGEELRRRVFDREGGVDAYIERLEDEMKQNAGKKVTTGERMVAAAKVVGLIEPDEEAA